jgi:hypothetical protein
VPHFGVAMTVPEFHALAARLATAKVCRTAAALCAPQRLVHGVLRTHTRVARPAGGLGAEADAAV